MANRRLFQNSGVIAATTVNAAGGKAYTTSSRHALAQIACTNTFNGTFYADAQATLKVAQQAAVALKKDPEFVAKVAIYCRNNGYMKDMPAFLCAVLAGWGEAKLFRKVFDKVINNGKMLRTFIQIARSGMAGKKLNISSGAVRHAIRDWFANRTPDDIFRYHSIGNDPNMRDVLKMSHPKPATPAHAALFAYLLGAEKNGETLVVKNQGKTVYAHPYNNLPANVREYEQFKATHKGEIPNVDFRMLDSVLSNEEAKKLWESQVEHGGWHTIRMNLNNFKKYGVFNRNDLTNKVAQRLADKDEIHRSKVFPYQLMTTYFMTSDVPHTVREALQDAMETSVDNVPELPGQIYVGVDVSGSMSAPVTGYRGSATTVVQCKNAAALFASAILRKNRSTVVLPFTTRVHACELNPRDTVLSNTKKLSRLPSGGTDCSSVVSWLNENNKRGDLVVIVSDNESWADLTRTSGTGLMEQWKKFKRNNPNAKLVCIDLTPTSYSQATEHQDILRVGGFSDTVFDVLSTFYNNNEGKDHWVGLIDQIEV